MSNKTIGSGVKRDPASPNTSHKNDSTELNRISTTDRHDPQGHSSAADDESKRPKGEGANVGGESAPSTKGANVTPDTDSPLCRAKATFKKWLELPDDNVLDFLFGCVFANKFTGDPVWGGLVGASGDTKTEVIRSLDGQQDVVSLTSLTSKTLISGLRPESAKGKEPSLLPKLDGKLLIVKDLTPLISGNRETRAEILGQLRDAYDGSSAMAFGTGELKEFKSRFGMVFGVTPAIESCWPVINQLGERFLYYRCPGGDSMLKIKAALRNSNVKQEMREELAAAAKMVLDQDVPEKVIVPDELCERIAHLADLVARARSPVKREGGTEEIEYAPCPEVGTRLAGQLIQLARGISVARGQDSCDESVMEVLRHVAISSIPQFRWRVLNLLSRHSTPMSTGEVGQILKAGSGSVKRSLEDLWSLDFVDRVCIGKGSSYHWTLSGLGRERLGQAGLDKEGEDHPTPDICTLGAGRKEATFDDKRGPSNVNSMIERGDAHDN